MSVLLLGMSVASMSCAQPAAPTPVVEADELVYSFVNPDNGSGPMWCFGNSCLVRCGERLFAVASETVPEAKPRNNTRWALYERTAQGWVRRQADEKEFTREPSPATRLDDNSFLVSVNPTLVPGQFSGPAQPEVLEFRAGDPAAAPVHQLPVWDGEPPFTEHSYRSFVGDGGRGEAILFQNIGNDHAAWAFRDASGAWAARGKLQFPWGAGYEEPEWIRVCYPSVALKDRAVHFCGVSDIIEPNKAWRAFKKELTGQNWDYDFRRLYYTYSPDITTGKFSEWIEVASRESTCGWIGPCDLYVAPDGAAHILWTERALDERLRAKFYPEAKQTHELNYAIIRDGKVVHKRTLLRGGEGISGEIPGFGRFQPTPEGRLFAIYHMAGSDVGGFGLNEMRLMELYPDGTSSVQLRVETDHPMGTFFVAGPRAGCKPSRTVELLGPPAAGPDEIRYLRVKLY